MIAADLVIPVRARTDGLQKDLNKSKGILNNFAKGFGQGGLFGTIASAAAPTALLGFFISMARQMDDANDAAEKLGMSLHTYLVFENVARRSATSIETIGVAFNRLKRSIGEGKAGGILGMDNEQLRKLAPEKAFMEAVQRIAGIQDPMKRARMEMELFGRGGAELDSVIMNLATNWRYWNEAVADEKAAAALARYGQAVEDAEVKLKKFAVTAAGEFSNAIKGTGALLVGIATGTNPMTVMKNMMEDEQNVKRRMESMDSQVASFNATSNALKELSKIQEKYDALVDPRGNAIENFRESLTGLSADDANQFVDSFTRLYDKMEAFKVAKQQTENWEKHIEEVKKFGEELKRSTQTPLEEFQDRMKEIEGWRKEAKWRYERTGEGMGNIDEVASRAFDQAKQKAIDALKTMDAKSPSGDALKNTREAYAAISEARRGEANRDIKGIEKNTREQIAAINRVDASIKKISIPAFAAANLN